MTAKPTIIDFVEKYTRQFASHVFLREKPADRWTETTFEQTRLEAYRVAAGLMALGINKGDKVSLLSEGRNMWVIGELGILYAGGVNVPLSIKLEEGSDLVFRIKHSDSRFVMVSGTQLPKVRRIIGDVPAVEKVIVFDELPEYQENEIPMSEVLKLGDKFMKENPGALEERYKSIQPDDYANISYTSGTTADPKGILLTHRNYTANVEQAHSVVECRDAHHPASRPLFRSRGRFLYHDVLWRKYRYRACRKDGYGIIEEYPDGYQGSKATCNAVSTGIGPKLQEERGIRHQGEGPEGGETLQFCPQARDFLQQGVLQSRRFLPALEKAVDGSLR